MTPTGKLELTTPSDREVLFVRRFDAPPDMVFDAWTKPELLKRWMYGLEGWRLDECTIDLRVGGRYRFVWRGPDGEEMGVGGEYKEVDRPHRLVTTELFDEDWTGGETLVTLVLTEEDGGTLTEMTVLYASKAARDGAMETPMAEGLEMGYARLDTIFATSDARTIG